MGKKEKIFNKLKKNDEGFTFVELLISLLLLALIASAFINAFFVSTKNNIYAHVSVDVGYIAQDCMEEVYQYSQDHSLAEVITEMINASYNYSNTGTTHVFTKGIDDYYVRIEIREKVYSAVTDELTKVVVHVYEDSAHTKQVASVQSILYIYL